MALWAEMRSQDAVVVLFILMSGTGGEISFGQTETLLHLFV